jgi:thymidylate synthase (FAD)
MKIELVSYTQPVKRLQDQGIITPIDLIAFCARVSNPANQFNNDTSEKLVNYLIKNKHWSPLEMVDMTLEIETTRDIARQILRHRSFVFQEFSQRYAVADLGYEFRDARLQDKKNRQNSIDVDDFGLNSEWKTAQMRVMMEAQNAYDWAIDNGIAKEVARSVLPEGMVLSRLYMKGTLRSWVHYIDLRSGNGTQKEHMLIAIEAAKVISQVFPIEKVLSTNSNSNIKDS